MSHWIDIETPHGPVRGWDVDIHSFEPASAALAWQRSTTFLTESLR